MSRILLAGFDAKRVDELIAMWRASFEAGVGVVDPHPLLQQREYLLAHVVPHNEVRLALLDDELVGFIAASRESIAQLYVRVGYQRLGIGGSMLAWAKLRSAGSLWLYTFARNAGARTFYERNGFVPVAHGFEPTWQLEDVKYEWLRGADNAA